MTDLANLNLEPMAEEGAELHLRHPATGEKLFCDNEKKQPMAIRLAGQDSSRYRNALRMQQNRNTRRRTDLTPAEIESQSIELLASVTLGWSLVENGQPIQCAIQEVKRVYETFQWIREQVAGFIFDRANFFKSA